MKVDWDKAIREPNTDLDGRKVVKVIYPKEKRWCKSCQFFYHERKFTRCEYYPKKFWRALQKACVYFKENEK